MRRISRIEPDVVSISRKLCFQVVAGGSKSSYSIFIIRTDKKRGSDKVATKSRSASTFEKSEHSPLNFRLFSRFRLPSFFARDIDASVRIQGRVNDITECTKKRFNLRWN